MHIVNVPQEEKIRIFHGMQPVAVPATGPDLQFSVAERLFLEVHGYVVVERFLPPATAATLRATLEDLEVRFRRTGERPAAPAFLSSHDPTFFRVDHLAHLAPCFHAYLSDPRILGRCEDMVGHELRLEQSDAHIRRPRADAPDRYSFHRHPRLGLGGVEHNGLYHYPFVKALTNLSDLGPDDGGTAVIVGSHKVPHHLTAHLIRAAAADPRLIHQVVAPAGSTLFFYESLIHSSGINRSGRPRPLIIGGYTPTLFQPQHGEHPDPGFLATLSPEHQALYSGSRAWEGEIRLRQLPEA